MNENIEKFFETSLKKYGLLIEGGYHTELITFDLHIGEEVSRYSILNGCANWEFTLGRFYLHFYVYTMGTYNATTSEGHIGAMFIIFGYLKQHIKLRIFCDNIFL